MTVPEVNLHTTLISAYRFLKTRDEFGAAQLLGALLLLSKHFPLEIQVIPKQEWQQTADAYLDELLSQWLRGKRPIGRIRLPYRCWHSTAFRFSVPSWGRRPPPTGLR